MKQSISFFLLAPVIWLLSSCSSGNSEKATPEKKDPVAAQPAPVDTTMRSLVGVIEKNPPVQEGEYVKKYPSGLIQMKGYYVGGKRNGQWVSFFENGKVQSEGFFKDGLRDGSAKVYFESGNLYYEGYYKDGKEVGKWVFYDEKGNVVNQKNYE